MAIYTKADGIQKEVKDCKTKVNGKWERCATTDERLTALEKAVADLKAKVEALGSLNN